MIIICREIVCWLLFIAGNVSLIPTVKLLFKSDVSATIIMVAFMKILLSSTVLYYSIVCKYCIVHYSIVLSSTVL